MQPAEARALPGRAHTLSRLSHHLLLVGIGVPACSYSSTRFSKRMTFPLKIRLIIFRRAHFLDPAVFNPQFLQQIDYFQVFRFRDSPGKRRITCSMVRRIILRHQADTDFRRDFFCQPCQGFFTARQTLPAESGDAQSNLSAQYHFHPSDNIPHLTVHFLDGLTRVFHIMRRLRKLFRDFVRSVPQIRQINIDNPI